MYGIDGIKAVLEFGFNLASRIKDITAEDSAGGKKVTIIEIVGSLSLLKNIPEIIRVIPELQQEYFDLDDTEVSELKAYFADRFNLSNDKAEAAIEAAWGIVLAIGKEIDIIEK